MLDPVIIISISLCYLSFLFAIAFFGDKQAQKGKSIISNPYIYALSLAVYCTAWTYYGSVGNACTAGITGFLPIYLGPTLMMILGWPVIRKIICISKVNRITSIADFIGSRYGKSAALAGTVTIIAVVGIIPYMSVQIKAVSTSFQLISQYPDVYMAPSAQKLPFFKDTALFVAILLAVFAVFFGTRHLDAAERHEGLVAAIAFESVVKLIAIITVGIYVTYFVYSGFSDLFGKAAQIPQLSRLFVMNVNSATFNSWYTSLFLAMMAIFLLPRQFQVIVVENVDGTHLNKAVWLFPLYLLAINIFVIPIAFGGMILFFKQCSLDPGCQASLPRIFEGILNFPSGRLDADYVALSLLMAKKQQGLTLFAYIGGMSAATGMVIVETIALSTMICNDLVMPVLLRLPFLNLQEKKDINRLLLQIRRVSILIVVLMGYLYFHYVVGYYSLVSIGKISFAAVAQFCPAVIGGIFWKGAAKRGAFLGLCAGFLIWFYTLVLPSLAQTDFFHHNLMAPGPFGIEIFNPEKLFGIDTAALGFDRYTHALFWSMTMNILLFIAGSVFSRPDTQERKQAELFVDVFKYYMAKEKPSFWQATASVKELTSLLERFLGKKPTAEALKRYSKKHRIDFSHQLTAQADLVSYAEKLLAGAIGSASALVVIQSIVTEEPLGIDEIMGILDETQQILIYSRELEKATKDLEAANERLKEHDRLKNEFISTVSHELRTPLTSVRALAEIIKNTQDLPPEKHSQFTEIIIKESERLSRLINDVLDFQKIESGNISLDKEPVSMAEVIKESISTTSQLITEKQIRIETDLEIDAVVNGDRDRLIQVMVNLISNAVKFCPEADGQIRIRLAKDPDHGPPREFVRIAVEDNGIGINVSDHQIIFHEFRQVASRKGGRPHGTGIGLTISKQIIDSHNGRIWVESEPDHGATFFFILPLLNS